MNRVSDMHHCQIMDQLSQYQGSDTDARGTIDIRQEGDRVVLLTGPNYIRRARGAVRYAGFALAAAGLIATAFNVCGLVAVVAGLAVARFGPASIKARRLLE